MDKPISMSVKDYLMRVQSVRTNTSLKIIETVVDNQFEGAREAMQTNESVEISGWGKFFFNTKKALKKYKEAVEEVASLEKDLKENKAALTRKESLEKWMKDIKVVLDGMEIDTRGVEKRLAPCRGYEDSDRKHLEGEVGNLPEM